MNIEIVLNTDEARSLIFAIKNRIAYLKDIRCNLEDYKDADEKTLKDVKSFNNYADEQIKDLQNILKQIAEENMYLKEIV